MAHRGEATRVRPASVEESVLGRGHDFMHELQREGWPAVLTRSRGIPKKAEAKAD